MGCATSRHIERVSVTVARMSKAEERPESGTVAQCALPSDGKDPERARKLAAAEAAFERAAIEAIRLRLEGRHAEANEAARKARWLYRDWKELEDPAA
jgi:hypothetical protein